MLRRVRRRLDAWQTPTVTSVNRVLRRIYGVGFSEKTEQARIEVNVDGSWSPRGTSSWSDTRIEHELPTLPGGAKVRVANCCDNVSNEFVVP